MIEALLRRAISLSAPPGAGSRLSVLIFHRVLERPDALQPDAPTAEEFGRRLALVKRLFNVLPLREAVRALRSGSLPARPLAITFDDGYADNHDLALPVLRSLGLPATFFIATGYLDGGIMFNDVVIESIRQARGDTLDLGPLDMGVHPIGTDAERLTAVRAILPRLKRMVPAVRRDVAARVAQSAGASLPDSLMMSRAQVGALAAAGMEIGGHTVLHPILSAIGPEEALREMHEGRIALQDIIGGEVRLFAYPNGRPGEDYRAQHVAMVRELGFEAAVSTAKGVASADADPFQIPRFTPWDADDRKFGLRLYLNLRSRGQQEV